MDEPGRHASTAPPASLAARGRMSANTTLVAGVGTLLLAMGIGVLIGRSAPSGSKGSGPVQVLAAPSTGTAATGSTVGAGADTEAAQGVARPGTTKAGSNAAGKGSKSTAKAPKTKLPAAKVVTVGSPGKGPGYEKGRFTGNFFGKGEE
jgi:hypothetical protein